MMFSSVFGKAISSLPTASSFTTRTWSSVSEAMAKILSFSEVNDKLKKTNAVLLDVREPAELTSDGKISGARNVPVGEFAAAFKLDDKDFNGKYGFSKPLPNDEIIIHCKAGVRAQNAAKVLLGSGYSKVEVYPGIMDWIENGGKVEK